MKIENRIKKQYSYSLYNKLYIFYYLCVADSFIEEDMCTHLKVSKRTMERYVEDINATRCYRIIRKKEYIDENEEDEKKKKSTVYTVELNHPFLDHSKRHLGSKIFIGYHHRDHYPYKLKNKKYDWIDVLTLKRRLDILYEINLAQRRFEQLDSDYYYDNKSRAKNANRLNLYMEMKRIVQGYYRNKNDRTLKRDLDLLFKVFNDVSDDLTDDDNNFISSDNERLIKPGMILNKDDLMEVKRLLHTDPKSQDYIIYGHHIRIIPYKSLKNKNQSTN